jgi:hypothetical protein
MITIDAGERQYELVDGWGQLPDGWQWGQVAGVACDSADQVHVYARTEHPYMVFDRSGRMLDHWGEGILDEAHSLYLDPQDSIFILSHRAHFILKFNKDGKHVLTLGKRGVASDTGYTKEGRVPGRPGCRAVACPSPMASDMVDHPSINPPTSRWPRTETSSSPTATAIAACTSSPLMAAG